MTRYATEQNANALCSILNEIIVIGGTAAYETKLNEASFCGFTDYTIRKGVPLLDGMPVDRLSKLFKI